MPRRKAGQLIAIEIDILVEALQLNTAGVTEFHGFALAKQLRDGAQSAGLTAHGTLYKALGRLETAGLLESSLENPDIAESEGRPRRRLYRLTSAGRLAAAGALAEHGPTEAPTWQPGMEPA